jgi:hypothetical protein
LEDTLINNGIRWYRHILRMNEDRTTKKVLNMKMSGNGHRER